MKIKCPKCGGDTTIMVQTTIVAPSELSHNFSKRNLRRKDVYLMGVNWETQETICKNSKCGYVIQAYGNYVSRLEKRIKQLEKK